MSELVGVAAIVGVVAVVGGQLIADGGGRAGEPRADPGTSGHGKFPPQVGWSAIRWEDNELGAQTGRPGAVGPVRLLGGATAPAALVHRPLPPLGTARWGRLG